MYLTGFQVKVEINCLVWVFCVLFGVGFLFYITYLSELEICKSFSSTAIMEHYLKNELNLVLRSLVSRKVCGIGLNW